MRVAAARATRAWCPPSVADAHTALTPKAYDTPCRSQPRCPSLTRAIASQRRASCRGRPRAAASNRRAPACPSPLPRCAMNRYDDRARLVFHFAREEGSKLGHAMIGPEHLLLGLMREGGSASKVLVEFGATLEGFRKQVEEMVGRGDGLPRNETAAITPRARRVMELAGSEARSLGSNVIATEHILLGVIREGDGVAYRILQQLTRDVDTVRWRLLAAADPKKAPETVATPFLDEYARDLTKEARDGQARPGHRPHRGDPARHPDPHAAHQEQPGADRRTGRRQDRDRRGARAGDRRGPRAAEPRRRARLVDRPLQRRRRHQVPRRVRGAAAAAHRGAQGGRGRRVHRRAAHAGRCRRRRGDARRGQHPQAAALARRGPGGRRHDHRRVPPLHREGRRARAPLPARDRPGALARGVARDPPRAAREVRGAPRRRDPRGDPRALGALRRALAAGTQLPRQGDRPDRRGGVAHAPQQVARLPRARGRRRHPHRQPRGRRGGRELVGRRLRRRAGRREAGRPGAPAAPRGGRPGQGDHGPGVRAAARPRRPRAAAPGSRRRSCSSARRASARPTWRSSSPSSSSAASARWCGSTCPSTRRRTRSAS